MGVRSVAGQVLLLQLTIVVLLVVVAVVTVVLQARRDSLRDARHRTTAAAQAFANAPGLVQAIQSPDAAAILRPRMDTARKATGTDSLAVITADGTIYGSASESGEPPPPQELDPRFPEFLRSGQAVTFTYGTPEGKIVATVVTVRDASGTGLGVVSAAVLVASARDAADRQLPVVLGSGAGALLLAGGGTAVVARRLRRQTHGLGPAEMTRMYEHHDAVLHAVREGVLITDGDAVVLANDEARRLLDLPADAEGRKVGELGLEPGLAELVTSERVGTDEVHVSGERLLAVNKRFARSHGGPAGSVVTLRDSTELETLAGHAETIRRRLRLLYEAGVRIGTTLDVTRTAGELADVAVPGFADHVTVDLLDQVLRGDEPAATASRIRRVASTGAHGDTLYPVDEQITLPPTSPVARTMADGSTALVSELGSAPEWRSQEPGHVGEPVDQGMHSLIAVPLRARGVVLGLACFWRARTAEGFDEEDAAFAEELSARAAVSIDNARRYTREHAMAATLQRALLPRGLPDQNALEVASRYLPAEADVGGDWFDVIPISGARVALVVGDVVGHGLHAAATMGRLRTAVHNFSALDLAPDELLGRLDDLVTRTDQDRPDTDDSGVMTGATCLYAIYDPTTGSLTAARAGHPGPMLLFPDGGVTVPDIPVSPPLGLGAGLPVETVELALPEDTSLVLFTDGLVEDRTRDIDTGLELLRGALEQAGPATAPEQMCANVVSAVVPERPTDDIALLIARTRRLGVDNVAAWAVRRDPAAVAPIRAACTRQLEAWGLEDAGFATELILSELVTNAVRYGSEPIQVRLLRNDTLICEVSDASSTSPHLRYAAATDEGGRGLLLVARYAERWGTRYTLRGKVIWAEQSLHGPADVDDRGADALLDQWDEL